MGLTESQRTGQGRPCLRRTGKNSFKEGSRKKKKKKGRKRDGTRKELTRENMRPQSPKRRKKK